MSTETMRCDFWVSRHEPWLYDVRGTDRRRGKTAGKWWTCSDPYSQAVQATAWLCIRLLKLYSCLYADFVESVIMNHAPGNSGQIFRIRGAQMALDGFVISNIVYELNQTTILNAKISKIAQPENDELLFTCKGKQRAVPSCHVRKRICLFYIWRTRINQALWPHQTSCMVAQAY